MYVKNKIDIKTFDNNDNYLERAVVMIAVVEPVRMDLMLQRYVQMALHQVF